MMERGSSNNKPSNCKNLRFRLLDDSNNFNVVIAMHSTIHDMDARITILHVGAMVNGEPQ